MVFVKVFCVRIGTKYGPEYEDYINHKLEGHEVNWIRDPFHPWVPLQWNKLQVFNMDINEPVIIMDIDKLLINEYEEVINYPCKKGEFVSIPYWWNFNGTPFKTSGGFYSGEDPIDLLKGAIDAKPKTIDDTGYDDLGSEIKNAFKKMIGMETDEDNKSPEVEAKDEHEVWNIMKKAGSSFIDKLKNFFS